MILAAGLAALYGRYDWSPAMRPFSLRGYHSAYLLVLTLPALYYIVRLFTSRERLARMALWISGTVLALPYRWLGLDRWYYNRIIPTAYDGPAAPQTDWLPGGLLHPRSMPHEILFFVLVALVAVAIAIGRSRGTRGGTRAWLALFLLLLLQTWLHLSMRSPYVYITHFEQPPEANYWYAHYLFPDGMGAVNADYIGFFRPMDDHFLGAPYPTNPIVIRRSYLHYLTTQLTYFVSPYYVYLIVNLALWLLACVAAHRLTTAAFDPRAAPYAAAMVATGPGFIMFVAQPMSYLAGYAAVVMTFLLVERALFSKPHPGLVDHAAMGVILGLAGMVYDGMPVVWVGLLIYAVVRGASLRAFAASLGVAWLVTKGFLTLQTAILGVEIRSLHSKYHDGAWATLYQTLAEPRLGSIYLDVVAALRAWLGGLVNAFFVLPTLLALAGLLLVRDRRRAALVLALGVPALLAAAFLQLGGMEWGDPKGSGLFRLSTLPRFVYIAYPAIYVLAALTLVELRDQLAKRLAGPIASRVAAAAPWLVLVIVFLLSNIDVFGYPQMYYLFYYPFGGRF